MARCGVVTKGAPDVLLPRCTDVQVGEGRVPLDDERRADALAAVERLSAQAYRTLGVAYRRRRRGGCGTDGLERSDEHDLVYVGVVGIIDPPRPEVGRAVAEAHRAGMRDHDDHRRPPDHGHADRRRTWASSRPGASAVTGAELDALSAERLREVTATTSVYARVAPQNKLQIVDALQAEGHVVAMTGDGVNDAPALKSADIGVAMGITGTEVTKEVGEDDPRRRQLRHHRRRRAPGPDHLRQHQEVPALPAVLEHG